jgi:hypothetical protein
MGNVLLSLMASQTKVANIIDKQATRFSRVYQTFNQEL